MKISHVQSKAVFQTLFRLERCGRYKDAFAELEDIWENIEALPNIEGFDLPEAAEIFLRCGSLIGFLGDNREIKEAQEKSKNLLTEARCRFLAISNAEKIAECENYLALAYWRTGELAEAETWAETALAHNLSALNHTRIYSHLIKSLIFLSAKKYSKIVKNFKKLEVNFIKCGDAFLTGSFCTNFGLALKNLGQTTQALKYLELAEHYHRKSGHQIYLGTVDNNLAQLYKTGRNFTKAHEAIRRAAQVFKKIKDRTREGFSLDTQAQIYIAEGRYSEALKTVETAIAILRKGENLAYLVETYLTKTKTLIFLNDISAATICLFDAVQIAKNSISEEKAHQLIKEFEIALYEKTLLASDPIFTEIKPDKDSLELILPPELTHYRDLQGIWIKNSHLEIFGLPKGSFAIVARGKVERGDLAAISELADDSVRCGFYDADFGIVSLDAGGEPNLFDESDIEIIGKIVGVCRSGKNSDGKMIIKLLTFDR